MDKVVFMGKTVSKGKLPLEFLQSLKLKLNISTCETLLAVASCSCRSRMPS